MAIILHEEYGEIIDLLNMEQRGELLTVLFDYSAGRELPEMSVAVKMAFTVIRQRADRDAEAYERTRKAHQDAGKKGGRPKKAENPAEDTESKENQKNQLVLEETKNNQTEPNESKKSNPIPIPISIPIEKEKSIKEKGTPDGVPARFKRPTFEEVDQYCRERGNSISAQGFLNYYDSNGWHVGKAPMKDWKAAVRTWEQRDKKTVEGPKKPANKWHNFEQRNTDYDAILKAEG